jgi:glycosyltransferase involved in cell wall biosynthesis
MERRCDGLTVYVPTSDELADRARDECDAWCPKGFAEQVRALARVLGSDVVMVQFVFFSRCLLGLPPGVVKVIDTGDVYADRRRLWESTGLSYRWFSTSRTDELRCLARADVIVTVKDNDRDTLQADLPEAIPVLAIATAFEAVPAFQWKTDELLFIGAMNPANEAGLRSFLRSSFPLICQQFPEVCLTVVGGISAALRGKERNVEVLGTRADPVPLYGRASIVINPVPCGTGIATKSFQAMAYGKCLVTTPAGALGLERWPDAYILVSSPEQFAQPIIGLLCDRLAVKRFGERAYQVAREMFSPTTLFAPLQAELERRCEQPR